MRRVVHLQSEPAAGEYDPAECLLVIGSDPETERDKRALLTKVAAKHDADARDEAGVLIASRGYAACVVGSKVVFVRSLEEWDLVTSGKAKAQSALS